ncbi:Carbonic anhydrase [Lentibacillus sp. JNUCC-1]|uniref:beta-class carbonic anhydrase n=1 Tax=Lentibacillus sp. JNUCC-1 TaxID=2654513 RepID=UPI0012E84401|nr:carbonic anhydrase [Lentibacillus sp. JNUCC-1]MUV38925.1 Carbonic anhydrase [Lentibacillus sp. JNUCC-1]
MTVHLDEMLAFNKRFVEQKDYVPYETNSVPNKKMIVFTCMESRLIELLLRSLNLKNGDVKMIKNAGAIIRKPFDSVMKSILVAVYELQAEEVAVIGHYDCGMSHMDTELLPEKMIEKGIPKETIDALKHAGIDFDDEFHGFDTVEESVQQSVNVIRNHPLLPEYVKVHGLVIDPGTGGVDVVTREV